MLEAKVPWTGRPISRRWIGRRCWHGGVWPLHGGAEALKTRKDPRSDAKPNDAQPAGAGALLRRPDPRQLSRFGFALWTRQMVGDLIFQRFRCGCRSRRWGARSSAWDCPRRNRCTWPTSRIRRRSPRKRHTYPEIRRRAAAEGDLLRRRGGMPDRLPCRDYLGAGRPDPGRRGHRGPPIDLHGSGRQREGEVAALLADQPLKAADFIEPPPPLKLADTARPEGKVFLIVDARVTPPRRSRRSSPTRRLLG